MRSAARARIAGLAAAVALAGVATAVPCLAACGIDTISYLSDEPSMLSDLVFEGPSTTNTAYLGIEIFYRIYESESDAVSDRSYLLAKQDAENSVPGSWIESYLASSSGLGYLRPVVIDRSDASVVGIPTIHKDLLSGDGSFVTIFSPSSGEEATIVVNDGTTDIATYDMLRNAKDQLDEYLSFLDKPVTGDDDLRTNSSDDDDTYVVQFFAVAYGFDIDSSSGDLFGDAVYIGSMSISY